MCIKSVFLHKHTHTQSTCHLINVHIHTPSNIQGSISHTHCVNRSSSEISGSPSVSDVSLFTCGSAYWSDQNQELWVFQLLIWPLMWNNITRRCKRHIWIRADDGLWCLSRVSYTSAEPLVRRALLTDVIYTSGYGGTDVLMFYIFYCTGEFWTLNEIRWFHISAKCRVKINSNTTLWRTY